MLIAFVAALLSTTLPSTTPPGYAIVTVDPSRIEPLALQTAKIEERELTKKLLTVGVVAIDETRTAHVHSKIRGFIEDIRIDYVGQRVSAGEPLCLIYSQEVYAAEMELAALLTRRSGAIDDPLIAAARRRLELWDVPKSELARLEKTREASRTFPLIAPRGGTVIAKRALQGMYIDPTLELYTLSDLSRVWVLADVYEADVLHVRRGDKARLEVEGGGRVIEADVVFVAPTIDEATRTRKIRFALDNRDGRLLPGAFVSIAMGLSLGKALAVPKEAVIRTGTRSIVFVAHKNHFMPREIELGPLAGDHYRVEAGLKAGDSVAVGAQFLLDSESRLQASSESGGGHAGHNH
jgi:membrane fusion protein, copper/silver efflux system